MRLLVLLVCVASLVYPPGARAASADQPASRAERRIEGFRVQIDERLLPGGSDEEVGRVALEFLAAKLADIRIVVPADKLDQLRQVTIVLDASCGDLHSMQYHPSGAWLESHG